MSISPFGAYLREKRTAAGKSLRSVAEALSITHVYLGEVERGRRRILPEKYWTALAREIPGVSVSELDEMASASAPLDPSEMEGRPREVVVALARALEDGGMSDDVADRLLKILEEKGPRDD